MGSVSYGLGADLSLPPSLPVGDDRYLSPRVEISGQIVWYNALAPRPEVLLYWCSVCTCADSL